MFAKYLLVFFPHSLTSLVTRLGSRDQPGPMSIGAGVIHVCAFLPKYSWAVGHTAIFYTCRGPLESLSVEQHHK